MILRGPAHPDRQPQYPSADDRIAEAIGEVGVQLIPFYSNYVIYKDLYAVRGGFVNWTYEHLWIFSYTNELWNSNQLLGEQSTQELASVTGQTRQERQLFANDPLMLGANFVEWQPFDHPTYGAIEIGGFVKQSQRVPPPFMLEELCHRNTAFVLYHADQMPLVTWQNVEIKPVGDGVAEVTAAVENSRIIPTRSAQARQRDIVLTDRLSISCDNLRILGGGVLVDPDNDSVTPEEFKPETITFPDACTGSINHPRRLVCPGHW